ncbi:hypothetical protein GFM13_00860 [Rhizobium leguminosarum bv. viciae]|nr:hypothetical protein [Rhizobium leguminosarum bv. viciae]
MNRDYCSAMTTFSKFHDIERIVGFFAFIPEASCGCNIHDTPIPSAGDMISPPHTLSFAVLRDPPECFPRQIKQAGNISTIRPAGSVLD